MKRICVNVVAVVASFLLTLAVLPLVGWTADTGAAVIEAGVSGADRVAEWLAFFTANGERLFACAGIMVVGVFGLAALIRAQVKLWKADDAGAALTTAVTKSGIEGIMRQSMDSATPAIKKTVWGWVRKK
jgi:hypothetical protein